jgi:hypothetical protein
MSPRYHTGDDILDYISVRVHKNIEPGPGFHDGICWWQDAHERADLALPCCQYVPFVIDSVFFVCGKWDSGHVYKNEGST